MTFSFYGYQPSRPEEYSNPIGNLISNVLGGYTEASKARYLQPKLEEELQKAKLFNKWYEPNIKSEIGLRGAHAGLLGEQTKGARIENQYLPQYKQAQIEQLQAQAQKARLLQMIREQFFQGGSPQGHAAMQNTSMGISQGQAIPADGQFQQPDQPSMHPGNYAQSAIAQQALGLGAPKIVESNGRYLAISPFGVTDTGAQGLSSQEKAFQSGLGKVKSEAYGESVKAFDSLQNQDLALNELKNSVENNPEFRNVTGPIKKPLTYWFGTKEQKKLLGSLQTSSGEIALQVAPSLKGAFTGRDQTLINSIKASPQDPPDVFIGKLRAQILINSALKERAKLKAQLIEQGASPIKSSEIAAKETPLERFEPMIKGLIESKPLITANEAKAEIQRRQIARQLNG